MDGVVSARQARTVFDHLIGAGVSPADATAHLEAGRVRVDSQPVTDPVFEVGEGAVVAIHLTPEN